MLKNGYMHVSDAERVQLATQRVADRQARERDLFAQRNKIACERKRRCHIRPLVYAEPCAACKDAGWLLFALTVANEELDRARDYLRRAQKRLAKGAASC